MSPALDVSRRPARTKRSWVFLSLTIPALLSLATVALSDVLHRDLGWLLAGLGGVLLYSVVDVVTWLLNTRAKGADFRLQLPRQKACFREHAGLFAYTALKGSIATVLAMWLLTNLTLKIDGAGAEAASGDDLRWLLFSLGGALLYVVTEAASQRPPQHKAGTPFLRVLLGGPVVTIALQCCGG